MFSAGPLTQGGRKRREGGGLKGRSCTSIRKTLSKYPGDLSMGKGGVLAVTEILGGTGRVKSHRQTSTGDISQDGPWVGEHPCGARGFLQGGQEQDQSTWRDSLFRVSALPRGLRPAHGARKTLQPLLDDVHVGFCHGKRWCQFKVKSAPDGPSTSSSSGQAP